MKSRRTLIRPPLKWQMASAPVPHPAIPVLAERGGTQLKTPRPVVLVDTREQNPFDFSRFDGWFAGIEKKPLKLGDYSVAGMEDVCVVERKDLSDLIPLVECRALRLCESFATHESLLPSTVGHHCRFEPSEVPLSPRGRKPEPHHSVTDRNACWTPGTLPVYGNSRTGRGACGFLSVPSSPLPLAGNQRSRALPDRQQIGRASCKERV